MPLAGASALVAAAMTHSEFLFRARGGGQVDGQVVLTGQVTAVEGGALVLSRWVEGCCSQDAELTVRVLGVPAAQVGDWLQVTGVPDGPAVTATSFRAVEPRERHEA